MDAHRRSSLSSTYVPNEYIVWLSPEDRRQLAPIESSLIEELSAYLLEHARAERLALVSAPSVELRTDPRLALGDCGIEVNLIDQSPPQLAELRAGGPASVGGRGLDAGQAYLTVGGSRHAIGPHGAVIGRSPDADVVLSSTDVSRRHAEIVPDAAGWLLVDLGSTNGLRLNSRSVGVPTLLTDGDVIEIGSFELAFEVY
jgi:predicted component of type VI protein secretion system